MNLGFLEGLGVEGRAGQPRCVVEAVEKAGLVRSRDEEWKATERLTRCTTIVESDRTDRR